MDKSSSNHRASTSEIEASPIITIEQGDVHYFRGPQGRPFRVVVTPFRNRARIDSNFRTNSTPSSLWSYTLTYTYTD